MTLRSILGYILSRWPTCRTVAKILESDGHLDSAVHSARPIANVWRPCCPSLRTNAELSTFCFAEIAVHEIFGQNQWWSLGINSARSISQKFMERHHIQRVLLCVQFGNHNFPSYPRYSVRCLRCWIRTTLKTMDSFIKWAIKASNFIKWFANKGLNKIYSMSLHWELTFLALRMIRNSKGQALVLKKRNRLEHAIFNRNWSGNLLNP
jgi:hypothetical protein